MARHPWLALATIGPSILMPAIEPAQAWFLKLVIDRLQSGGSTLDRAALAGWVPAVAGVWLLLFGLRYLERMANRVFDERLLIDLQRAWFDRRGGRGDDEALSRLFNDCDRARKVLDLVQRDGWVIIIGLGSVLVWQQRISAPWLPALLVAMTPILAVAILAWRRVPPLTHHWLHGSVAVAGQARGGDRTAFQAAQEEVYRGKIRCEWWKMGAESVAEATAWSGIALVLLLAGLCALPLMPARIAAGDLAMFWTNLALVGKVAVELAKAGNKAAEGWPAAVRVLRPEWVRM